MQLPGTERLKGVHGKMHQSKRNRPIQRDQSTVAGSGRISAKERHAIDIAMRRKSERKKEKET